MNATSTRSLSRSSSVTSFDQVLNTFQNFKKIVYETRLFIEMGEKASRKAIKYARNWSSKFSSFCALPRPSPLSDRRDSMENEETRLPVFLTLFGTRHIATQWALFIVCMGENHTLTTATLIISPCLPFLISAWEAKMINLFSGKFFARESVRAHRLKRAM